MFLEKQFDDVLRDTTGTGRLTINSTSLVTHGGLGWVGLGLCCLMTPGLSKDIWCHV